MFQNIYGKSKVIIVYLFYFILVILVVGSQSKICTFMLPCISDYPANETLSKS